MTNASSLAILFSAAVATGLALTACGDSNDSPAAAGSAGSAGSGLVSEARSDKSRETAPSVTDADKSALAQGNAAFALDLYHQAKAGGGNLIYSPFSTSIALAMTHAGARNATEQQMAATLHFTLPQDKLHAAFNQLDLELQTRNQAADPATGKGFRLNVANALWGQKGKPFLAPFLDTLAVNYGAGMNLVDFIGDSESARLAINQWVSDKTEAKIKDLLQPPDIDADTRLVLTNAIYFNASWRNPFKTQDTADGTFHALSGSDVSVKMMHQTDSMSYAEGTDWQAIELAYEGGKSGMTIVLPAPGKFDAVEAALTAEWLGQLDASKDSARVALTMPKFSFISRFDLVKTLQALGMIDPFLDTADFSGMLDPAVDALRIKKVIHQAFIGVDENGTEAAAATAVVVGIDGGMAPPPKDVVLDRPFVFFIRDYPTGAILFSGRVVDPTQS